MPKKLKKKKELAKVQIKQKPIKNKTKITEKKTSPKEFENGNQNWLKYTIIKRKS